MRARLTAQLVLSNREAVLAYSLDRQPRGDCGECWIACLLCTADSGHTWNRLSLRRTLMDRLSHWGYPTWPPETVVELKQGRSGIDFVCRDEWVPYSKVGGESLWHCSQRSDGKWTTSWLRYMDYEHADSPASIDEIPLNLPETIRPPDLTSIDKFV